MRWCMIHSPEGGVGLVKCGLCDEPVADHEMVGLCR